MLALFIFAILAGALAMQWKAQQLLLTSEAEINAKLTADVRDTMSALQGLQKDVQAAAEAHTALQDKLKTSKAVW